MKVLVKILCCLLMGTVAHVSTHDMPKNCAERMKEIEIESYKAIDDIFADIRGTIINKQEKSVAEWFKYLKDNELQALLTEARIHCFDTMTPNTMSAKIDAYLQKKIRGDLQLVVTQGADIKAVKQFLGTSHMMCELSDGVDCKELIRVIKEENRQVIEELKKQKEAQQKEIFLARENLLSQSKK